VQLVYRHQATNVHHVPLDMKSTLMTSMKRYSAANVLRVHSSTILLKSAKTVILDAKVAQVVEMENV